jgi:DNA-directed RNA polymerase subunit omega
VIHPRIDELLENVDSRYALVIVAAKRARQINDYHHQLGEGIGFEQAPPPLAGGLLGDHAVQLAQDVAVPSGPDSGLGIQILRVAASLTEPFRLDPAVLPLCEPIQRVAAPQAERLPTGVPSALRLTCREQV